MAVLAVACWAGGAPPAAPNALDGESPATTFVVRVRDQARLEVPSSVSFDVDDPAARTLSRAVSVGLKGILLSRPASLRVLVRAADPAFTPPDGRSATWRAEDISWGAAAWSEGTGFAGTLSAASFTPIAVTTSGASQSATSDLVFSLNPSAEARRAGLHTLTVVWKVESMVPQE